MSLKPGEKPPNPEQDYFVRKDLELQARLREKLSVEESKRATEALREAHYMHCPKCGHALKEEIFQSIKIDRCTACSGVWLDNGELGQISKASGSWFTNLVESLSFTDGRGDSKP